ncbi:MAG: nucleotidyltransferase domain-containing protein [Muribaculaceae bacterium]|nr:nucleotidyltransferase domain-containing protein [Muribaculaceae bacterium]MDE6553571.1 nucleotidyltransferase domain-containing protein [Muribaculaceae bacterium]MDE7350146.1 nucleotidyltransferase domain-containing protein [Muribaculaceae bacterium]
MRIIDIEKIKRYFAGQPVVKAWLFGSFARGEEKENSDIDILVSFDDQAKVSLLRHAGMLCDLEDLLKRPVDLVNELSLYPEVRETVNNDKILIYERGA